MNDIVEVCFCFTIYVLVSTVGQCDILMEEDHDKLPKPSSSCRSFNDVGQHPNRRDCILIRFFLNAAISKQKHFYCDTSELYYTLNCKLVCKEENTSNLLIHLMAGFL